MSENVVYAQLRSDPEIAQAVFVWQHSPNQDTAIAMLQAAVMNTQGVDADNVNCRLVGITCAVLDSLGWDKFADVFQEKFVDNL